MSVRILCCQLRKCLQLSCLQIKQSLVNCYIIYICFIWTCRLFRMIKKKGSRNIKHIWADERYVQNSKVAYIYVRFLQVVSWCKICCKNMQSKQNFGMWMYFQISLSLWELQKIRDMLSFLRQEIGKKSLSRFFSVAYLHVIYKAWKRYSYWGVSITLSNTFTTPY